MIEINAKSEGQSSPENKGKRSRQRNAVLTCRCDDVSQRRPSCSVAIAPE